MTAEIAILNREGIALAADSAVTITRKGKSKTINSANKIFQLSKHQPISIMIYNNAGLMGVPWEIIIKQYRRYIGTQKFDKVEDYANSFFKYVQNPKQFFSSKDQKAWVSFFITFTFIRLAQAIDEKVENLLRQHGSVKKSIIDKLIESMIEGAHEIYFLKSKARTTGYTKATQLQLSKQVSALANKDIGTYFNKFKLKAKSKKHLREIALSLFTHHVEPELHPTYSGIVFAGYGETEYFPALHSYLVYGVCFNRVIYTGDKSREINGGLTSVIIPFAQGDVVSTFMEGIAPNYKKHMFGQFVMQYSNISKEIRVNTPGLSKKTIQILEQRFDDLGMQQAAEFLKALEDFRQRNFVGPVIDIVDSLPKDELAEMAESLVTITSFKRRISMDLETVGGPVDVAVISKGDGFVWIKRKHYFPKELNHHFYANYYQD